MFRLARLLIVIVETHNELAGARLERRQPCISTELKRAGYLDQDVFQANSKTQLTIDFALPRHDRLSSVEIIDPRSARDVAEGDDQPEHEAPCATSQKTARYHPVLSPQR